MNKRTKKNNSKRAKVKTSKKMIKNKRGGAMSAYSIGSRDCMASYTKVPDPKLPGETMTIQWPCQQRGGTKKKNQKKRAKQTKKIDQKKLNLIIDKLCASIKHKCTPKYRKLLKKIVVNNL